MATSTDADARPRGRRSARQRIADLPVGRKLTIGFGALTTVLILVICSVFVTVAKLGDANHEVVYDAAFRAQNADQLRIAAAELRATQLAYVLDAGAGRAAFDQATSRFSVALAALRVARNDDRTELALTNKIETGYQTYLSTDLLIWEALQRGDQDVVTNLALGAERLAFELMQGDLATLATHAELDRVAAGARFDATSTRARQLGGLLALLALVVMSVASAVITRLIRNPLHRVQQAAERAADGDINATADVSADDETGRLARAFNSMLAKLRLREEALRAEHHREERASRVHRAFEMSDDERTALEVIGLSLDEILPGRSAELLLANNSKSSLEQAVVAGPHPDGPGCPVASPFSCIAVRSGSPVTFASSTAVDACPHLRGRGGDPCSAVCVPVTFMGRAMGVIHAIDRVQHVPTSTEIDAVSMLSTQAGARIGMLRTMARTQVQAATDSLTGLMNRRTFQSRLRSLRREHQEFALVMADIDHFKRVNDTHGHETGDRAIKTFTDVATSTLRESDIMARWGGEEFAIALPGLDADEAAQILDRVRLELGVRLSTSDLPGFTVSFGIVSASECDSLEDAIRLADDALYEAKARGRDRAVVADPSASPRSAVAPAQPAVRRGVLAGMVVDDDPTES